MVRKLFSISLIAVILLTVSCAKMKDDTIAGGINNQSTATKSMEQMGQNMGQDMADVMTSPGVMGVMSMMPLMGDAFPMPGIPDLGGLIPVKKNSKKLTQSQLLVAKVRSVVTAKQINDSPKGLVAMNTLFKKAGIKDSKLHKKILKANKIAKKDNDEENQKFDFDKNKGIYEYSKSKEDWVKVSSSDKIVMKYDFVDSNSVKHKGVLTISAFDEKEFTIEGEKTYLPTSIVIDLVLDGDLVASLDYSGEYYDDMMPKMINLDIFLTPFRLNVNYSDKGDEISAGLSLTKEGEIIIAFGINIKFTSANKFENIANAEEDFDIINMLVSIDGFIQYRTMKVTAYIDVATIAKKGEKSKAADLNDAVDIKMINTESNETIMQIVFKDGEENMEIFVKFSDGTEQAAEEFFAGLAGGNTEPENPGGNEDEEWEPEKK